MHIFVDGETLTAAQLNGNFNDLDRNSDSRLRALEADTGWTNISANGSWAANSPVEIRKAGKTVYLAGWLALSSGVSIANYSNVLILPAQYRPLVTLHIPLGVRKAGATPEVTPNAILRVLSTGSCDLYTATSGTGAFLGGVSWIV